MLNPMLHAQLLGQQVNLTSPHNPVYFGKVQTWKSKIQTPKIYKSKHIIVTLSGLTSPLYPPMRKVLLKST